MTWSIFLLILIVIAIAIVLLVIYCKFSADHERSIHEILYPSRYSTRFHESMFICKNDSYDCRVKNGYYMMSKHRVNIIGLAYNIGNKVEKLLRRCQRLLEPWQSGSKVVIYCYDSTDNTFPYLKEKQAEYPWLVLPEVVLENKKNMTRLVRMANLRNLCLQYLNDNTDYTLIMDFDLSGPLSIDGLANSLSYMDLYEKDSYDVVCANGMLSVVGLNMYLPFFGWNYYDPFAVKLLDGTKVTNSPFRNMIMKRGDQPFEVISGFGGAALYKTKVLQKYHYIPDEDECEHVILHQQMHDDGHKIAINPSLIVLAGVQGGS